jgi:hypothetical protein
MNARRILPYGLGVILFSAPPLVSQPAPPSGVRQMTREEAALIIGFARAAVAGHAASPGEAVRAFSRDYLASGHPHASPLVWTAREAEHLELQVYPPAAWLYLQLQERIRKVESLDDPLPVRAENELVVFLTPKTIDAPDIVKIVIEQAGVLLQPTFNQLEPRTGRTGFGVPVTKHGGVVYFDASRLSPRETARILLIPERGANLEWALEPAALAMLR